MRTGTEGINLIKHFEGLHDGDLSLIGLQPKMCPAGIWTEGYGNAMRDENGKFIKGIENKQLAYSRITIHDEAYAQFHLIEDLKVYENLVSKAIKIELTQNQFDSLVSYWYNTGGSENLAKLINNKYDKKEIEMWFKNHYITGGGKVLKGLVLRRTSESELYFR